MGPSFIHFLPYKHKRRLPCCELPPLPSPFCTAGMLKAALKHSWIISPWPCPLTPRGEDRWPHTQVRSYLPFSCFLRGLLASSHLCWVRKHKLWDQPKQTSSTSYVWTLTGESTGSSPCCKPKYSFSVTPRWPYAKSRSDWPKSCF